MTNIQPTNHINGPCADDQYSANQPYKWPMCRCPIFSRRKHTNGPCADDNFQPARHINGPCTDYQYSANQTHKSVDDLYLVIQTRKCPENENIQPAKEMLINIQSELKTVNPCLINIRDGRKLVIYITFSGNHSLTDAAIFYKCSHVS